MAVSFDLYGTLVNAQRPTEPWSAVARELSARGVTAPEGWEEAYRSSHHDLQRGEELSLVAHTDAALASCGVDADERTIERALLAAFDGPVELQSGAHAALRAAARAGPVGLLSNCSLPGLVERTLDDVHLPVAFDAVVTSVDCGWRKPHDRAFEAVADRLGSRPDDLIHVGDDPRADGGARTTGATPVLLEDVPLAAFPAWLEGRE